MSTDGYHHSRFPASDRRRRVWAALWRYYFSKLIPADARVLDLGAGRGEFINTVRCAQRYAVDQWPEFRSFLDPAVHAHVGSVTDLGFLADASIDWAMASNVFEHLDRRELPACLAEIRRTLRPTGQLCVLQPNYRFAFREYFDDYTHVGVFSDRSLPDLLVASGFTIVESIPRFLPMQVQSRWPVWEPLIALYLASPFKPGGKQMLVRARPA
jgi:SAM-dependent methyltransferase